MFCPIKLETKPHVREHLRVRERHNIPRSFKLQIAQPITTKTPKQKACQTTPYCAIFAIRDSRSIDMKSNIHPKYQEISVECSCGNSFTVNSTLTDKQHLDICSKCHPFYTGQQKMVDTAGRIDRFHKKYASRKPAKKKEE